MDLSFLLAVNDTVSKVPYCHASNLLCLFACVFVCIVIYLFVNCQRHSLSILARAQGTASISLCISSLFRLTPSYMFTILFFTNMIAFLGDGPLWYGSQTLLGAGTKNPCVDKWWTNLLYINNLYPNSLIKEVRDSNKLLVYG